MRKILFTFICFCTISLLYANDGSKMTTQQLFWNLKDIKTFEEWSGYSSKEQYFKKSIGYTGMDDFLKTAFGCTTLDEYLTIKRNEYINAGWTLEYWDEESPLWVEHWESTVEEMREEFAEYQNRWDELLSEYDKYVARCKTDYPRRFCFAEDIEDFYDVNGDGVLEWHSDNRLYGIHVSDSYVSQVSEMSSYGAWRNINNDIYIDVRTQRDASGRGYNNRYYKGDPEFVFNDGIFTPNNDDSKEWILLDYNNDGHPDLVQGNRNGNKNSYKTALTIYGNGDSLISQILLQTAEERAGIKTYTRNSGPVSQSASTALGFNNVVSGSYSTPRKYNSTYEHNLDFNGDGISDYLDEENGIYIQNMGDGTAIYNNLGGKVKTADINNDGIMDLLTWNINDQSLCVYFLQRDGNVEKKTIFSGAVGNNVWCYDFDKDEDIDLLLTYEYRSSLGCSFLVLVENKGNGEFKNHEYFYESDLEFYQCIDFDSDGYYETLALERTEDNKERSVCYFNINAMKIDETPSYINGITCPSGNLCLADFDNSGIMRLINSDGNCWYITTLSDVVNEKPFKPETPTFTYNSSTCELKINWKPSTDKESSAADLTYALRIGTSPNTCDILYVHAHDDGTRKNMLGGNQGHALSCLLNTTTWKEGKYYISVQAVDPNNRGSEFSEAAIFEKKDVVLDFALYNNGPIGVGDTCVVALHPNADTSNTFVWDFDGARVVGQNSNGHTNYIVFDEPGIKQLTLTMTDSKNGEPKSECLHTIDVQPFSVTVQRNDEINRIMFGLDLDEDGYMEFYHKKGNYDDTREFYTFLSDGKYKKIPKLFNTNAYIQKLGTSTHLLDINKDGKCDIFSRYDEFGNTGFFSMINEGEKNMTINTDLVNIGHTEPTFRDFNNDGWVDCVYRDLDDFKNYLKKNNAGYTSFEKIEIPMELAKSDFYKFEDYTNDGLTDILIERYDKKREARDFIVYKNLGDFTFQISDTVFSLIDGSFSYQSIEDFDNDGKMDALGSKRVSGGNGRTVDAYYIYWNDGQVTFLEEASNVSACPLDFNNDGFLDFEIKQAAKSQYPGILTLNSDRSYSVYDQGDGDSGLSAYTNNAFLRPDGCLSLEYRKSYTCNSVPEAPSNLSAGRNDKGITLTWSHSKDKETPECRMRYNLSVKKKGEDGEGAYLISPCNSTKNGVHVPSNHLFVKGNRFFIPIASIPAGEYEVQVQAVDMQMQESDYSEVFNLIVSKTFVNQLPAVTGVGVETEVKVDGNATSAIDWNGGTVVSQRGNTYSVVWQIEGLKTIAIGNETHTIYVQPMPEVAFILPETILKNAKVIAQARNARNSKWMISADDGVTFEDVNKSEQCKVDVVDNDNVEFTFKNIGNYIVKHVVETDFGNSEYECSTVIIDECFTPELLYVTAQDGKNKVVWTIPQNVSADVTSVNVYKETEKTDCYRRIATVDLGANEFVDMNSNSDARPARYTLSYLLSYGESEKCTPHQSMHVMINRGIGNSWNLTWTKYEGRKVETYRILRGNDSNNLNVIAEVSGNMNTYCDMNQIDETLYYAVEMVYSDVVTQESRLLSSSIVRSNVVSTDNANEVYFVESILLSGGVISASEKDYVDLHAYVYPYYATYQSVNWTVEKGEALATIDKYGRLTATGKGNGEVIVRAYSLDGSGVYAETAVQVQGVVPSDITETEEAKLIDVNLLNNGHLIRVCAPLGTYVAIYNLSGYKVADGIQGNGVSDYQISQKGIYIFVAGDKRIKFICR